MKSEEAAPFKKKMCGSLDFANQQRVRASLLLGSIYRTKVFVQNRNDSPWSKGQLYDPHSIRQPLDRLTVGFTAS